MGVLKKIIKNTTFGKGHVLADLEKEHVTYLKPRWEKFAFITMADIGLPDDLNKENFDLAKDMLFNMFLDTFSWFRDLPDYEKQIRTLRKEFSNTRRTPRNFEFLRTFASQEKELKIRANDLKWSRLFVDIQNGKMFHATDSSQHDEAIKILEQLRQLCVLDASVEDAKLRFDYANALMDAADKKPGKHHDLEIEFFKDMQRQSINTILAQIKAQKDLREIEQNVQSKLTPDALLFLTNTSRNEFIFKNIISKNRAEDYQQVVEGLMGKSKTVSPLLDNHDVREPISAIDGMATNEEDPAQLFNDYIKHGNPESLFKLRELDVTQFGGQIKDSLDRAEQSWIQKASFEENLDKDATIDAINSLADLRIG